MANVSLAQGLDAPYKIAAASPKLIVGDPIANADIIISTIRHANKLGVDYLSPYLEFAETAALDQRLSEEKAK